MAQDTPPYNVTKQQQLDEFASRVTPIVNVDIIVHKEGRFLVGKKDGEIVFPGGRMKFDETINGAVERIGAREIEGISFSVQKLITCLGNKGYDKRANGVTLYYLCQYEAGKVTDSDQLDDMQWLSINQLFKIENWQYMNKLIASDLIVALASANSSEDEMIVEVDKNDVEIGSVQKRVAHVTSEIYHRSTQIIVINDAGNVILHQRAKTKSSAALKWDLFGGHVKDGSTPENTAHEELQEELGITAELSFVAKPLLQTDHQSEFMYVYSCHHNGPYNFDPNEVEQIAEFNIQKLINGRYSDDFDILPHVIEYLKIYSANI